MEINYNSIGVFQCKFSRPFEVHRQGVLSSAQRGFIQIFDFIDLQCLEDIEGFERIWVIYDFHLNKSYRPKVRTPRVDVPKKGVFATRSPYRPNSIGLSCVKLERLEGRKLWVSEFDILNESPILDIKPYLAYADSFENAKSGWVPKMKHFSFVYEERAAFKINWIFENLEFDLKSILEVQLGEDPINRKTKRIKRVSDLFELSVRAWRCIFKVNETEITVLNIHSGIVDFQKDQRGLGLTEIALHKKFQIRFN